MADERSRTLRANEKTKSWSTVIANLGTALFAAAFGRLWLMGVDPWAIVWGVIGGFVIMFGIHLLHYLEPES